MVKCFELWGCGVSLFIRSLLCVRKNLMYSMFIILSFFKIVCVIFCVLGLMLVGKLFGVVEMLRIWL